jgi:TetR/AcrR family tetracycline transcriptional repressor
MGLDRKDIVDAALILLNEVGIDALSTRKLAERLGVQQPALYWHFANKRALLNAMNEEILRQHYGAAPVDDGWEAFLRHHGQSFRDALLSVRDGARVHAGSPPTAEQFVEMEARLQGLKGWGFSTLDAMQGVVAINSFVLGSVMDEQADAENRLGWERATPGTPAVPHPALSEGLDALRLGGRQSAFDAGLGMIIEGLKPLRASSPGRTTRRKLAPAKKGGAPKDAA